MAPVELDHDKVRQLADEHRQAAEANKANSLRRTLTIIGMWVVVSVIAGLVIAAFAQRASENLQDQLPETVSLCAPWELYSTELAAAGVGGGSTSTAVGCMAPCYLTLNDSGDTRLDLVMRSYGSEIYDREGEIAATMAKFLSGEETTKGPIDSNGVAATILKFDTSGRPPEHADLSGANLLGEVRLGVTYLRQDPFRRELSDLDDEHDFYIHEYLGGATTDYVWNANSVLTSKVLEPGRHACSAYGSLCRHCGQGNRRAGRLHHLQHRHRQNPGRLAPPQRLAFALRAGAVSPAKKVAPCHE